MKIELIPKGMEHFSRPDSLEIDIKRKYVHFRMNVDGTGKTVNMSKSELKGLL